MRSNAAVAKRLQPTRPRVLTARCLFDMHASEKLAAVFPGDLSGCYPKSWKISQGDAAGVRLLFTASFTHSKIDHQRDRREELRGDSRRIQGVAHRRQVGDSYLFLIGWFAFFRVGQKKKVISFGVTWRR